MFGLKDCPVTAEVVAVALKASVVANETYKQWDEKEHAIWCEQTLRQTMAVTVSEPETRGSYMTKHVTYLVREEPHSYTVRRRYSDFQWLHKTLAMRFLGMLIPSLPEKTMYQTDTAIMVRMRGLNLFVYHLMNIPYFRSDASVLAFLSVQDDREWENAKRITTNLESAGEGHLRWMRALQTVQIPSNVERVVLDVRRQMDPLERHLAMIASSTKKLSEKSMTMSKEMAVLNDSFMSWQTYEDQVSDVNKVEYVIEGGDILRKVLAESRIILSNWSEIAGYQPAIHEYLLHENLKYLLQQVKDIRDILKMRESLIQDEEKNAVTRQGHQNDSNRATEKDLATRIKPRDVMVAEKEASQHRLEVAINFITRALFYSEFVKLNEIKAKVLHETLGQLAAAEYQFAKRLRGMWQTFMASTQMDKEDMILKTKQIMDLSMRVDLSSSSSTSSSKT